MFHIKFFIKCAIHLGHQTQKWNPKTSFFLLGIHNHDDVHIIDLNQTFFLFRRALSFVQGICTNKGFILYISSLSTGNISDKATFPEKTLWKIGKKPEIQNYLSKTSSEELLHKERKKGGTWKSSSKTLRELIISLRKTRIQRERIGIPEALFILNPEQNRTLIREAIKLQIPIIGIIDSNTDPFGVQYPIPGNNISSESLNLYTRFLMHSIVYAKKHEIKQLCK